ncbi:helix-turn-helix domain-containing protein [Chitinophaga flava]|uniref:HTH araC/xylS-type domain-containing protein n=1 Tax=Chitinophaga flava TaxID=2259036 RepID=A0A365XP06_9BACT|nr:AraC family transcriptional regulator [Chitinophaga flava]RBL88069.1 hypothetical protein DF182_31570 [Chitinophaga flava]
MKATKILYIEREDQAFTPHQNIPTAFRDQLIPYARFYFQEDNDGCILDQNIRAGEFSIWAHHIHMRPGVEIRPCTQYQVITLHAYDDMNTGPSNNQLPLEKEVCLFNMMASEDPVLPGTQQPHSFHINIEPDSLRELAREFPLLHSLAAIPVSNVTGPLHKAPFQLNAVSRLIRDRMLSAKHIGNSAYSFFRRNAADFYGNYTRRLIAPPPIMMNQEKRQLLHDIFNYILEHLHESLTYKTLEKKFGVEEALLRRPFEQEFHLTIPELILQEKMALAFELLSTRNTPVSYIMDRLGFTELPCFLTTFEKYYKYGALQVMDAQ